eukprot:gene11453-15344_t
MNQLGRNNITVVGENGLANHLVQILLKNNNLNVIEWEDDEVQINGLKLLIVSNSMCSSFRGINDTFIKFVNLEYLNLSFNSLRDIQVNNISCLKNLKLLDLSHNKITSIDFVESLSLLTVLRCHNNIIEEIIYLKNIANLRELNLSYNKIVWLEFYHLQSLKKLENLIKFCNPCDEKAKLDEFLIHIIPSLNFIDGLSVKVLNKDINNNGNAYDINPSENGVPKSVDLKVMLTQARAFNFSRMNSSDSPQGSPLHRRINSSHINLLNQNNGGRINSTPNPTSKIKKKSSNSNDMIMLNDDSNSIDNDNEHSINKKQTVSKKNIENNVFEENDSLVKNQNHTIEETLSDGGNVKSNGKYRIKGQRLMKKHSSKFLLHDAAVDDTVVNGVEINNEIRKGTLIKFSDDKDAPIALSLQDNKEGYARWSNNGPIACTVEQNRLFASYRNGAIAVVYDLLLGNGSVMDNRGRCLLVISPADGNSNKNKENNDYTAKLLDKFGNTTVTYTKGKICDNSVENNSAIHQWDIEGLKIYFDHKNWELKVNFQNERIQCEFSSISKCELIDVKPIIPSSTKKKSGNNNKKGNKANDSFEINDNHTVVHQSMRNDIGMVQSNLDVILSYELRVSTHSHHFPTMLVKQQKIRQFQLNFTPWTATSDLSADSITLFMFMRQD